jgi:hypothetical protein
MTAKKKSSLPATLVMCDGGVLCQRCWKVERMPTPMPMEAMQHWFAYIGELHRNCEIRPAPPPPRTPEEWLASHDTGTSSKTIYRHMMGLPQSSTRIGYPHDPDDFGRCFRLLRLMPAWRDRIGEMAAYGRVWNALAQHWANFTELYLEELPSGSCPKLYARMKELGA